MAMTAGSARLFQNHPTFDGGRDGSPWAMVVQSEADAGNGTSSPELTSPSSNQTERDEVAFGDEGKPRKPVWNTPSSSNDVAEVMGAKSWPALSESTKSAKQSLPLTSELSQKSLPDAIKVSPNTAIPLFTQKPNFPRPAVPLSNPAMQPPHRPMKKVGNAPFPGSIHGMYTSPPSPPPFAGYHAVPMRPEEFTGWNPKMSNNFPALPQNFPRKNNYGPHGNPPNQSHLGFRNGDLPPPRPLFRPMINTPPFSPIIPFSPVAQSDYYNMPGYPMDPYMPPAPLFPPVTPSVMLALKNQIEYYFSDDNLIKDSYLRSRMDDDGWVSISLLAGFNRIKSLTTNFQVIADSVRNSSLLEVKGQIKIRRKNDWKKWIIKV